MKVKKIGNAPFHNANGLNGQKSTAKYGVFQNGEQVGYASQGNSVWNAHTMDGKSRLLSFSCSTLKQLKSCLSQVR